MEKREEEQSTIFSIGTALSKDSYSLADFLTVKEHKKEQAALKARLQEAAGKVKGHIELPDAKSESQWNNLVIRPKHLSNAEESLRNIIVGFPERIRNSIYAHNLGFIFRSATYFSILEVFEREKQMAEMYGFLDLYSPLVELSQFMMCGEIIPKIGGVSIRDVMRNQKLSPSSFARFCIEATFVKKKFTHQTVLSENSENPLTTAFPNIAKNNIQEAAGQIIALTDTRPEDLDLLLDYLLPNPPKQTKEIIETAKKMVKRFSELRGYVLNTLVNPNSSYFPSLKETVENYLIDIDEETRISALQKLGLNTYDDTAYVYRKSRELARLQDNNSFYDLLANSIRKLIEEFPQETVILTEDDIPLFVRTDQPRQEQPLPTPEQLRKLAGDIYQKTTQREWILEPVNLELFNSTSLIPPVSTKVLFPKGNSRTFIITLSYENEQGEAVDLELEFDTRKSAFDCVPFVPSPDDAKMRDMKNASLLASHAIMLDVQKQVDREHQERQREKATKMHPVIQPKPSVAKPVPGTPYAPREKEKALPRPRPLTPIQEVLQSEITLPFEQKRIKNQIILPPKEALDKMTESLSSEDRALVIKRAEEYNQRNVGTFKMLRFPGKEDKPLFTLRVNCGTGGGIRVLMHEVPNHTEGSNTRVFEILDIDYRKNIYRKRQLE